MSWTDRSARLAALAPLLLAATVPSTAAAAAAWGGELAAEEERSPLAEEVCAQLRRSRTERGETDATIAEELAALGGPAIEPLFELLETRVVPRGPEGEPAQRLSIPQAALALDALARMDAPRVLAALDLRLAGEPAADRRAAAVRVLGAVGDASGLPRLVDLSNGPADEAVEERTRLAFQEAVVALLRRDPDARDALQRSWPALRDELLETLAVAICDAGDKGGLGLLTELASWRPDLRRIVVGQVPRLAPGPDPAVDARLAELLREGLDPSDRRLCQATALALAALEDDEAAPLLVSLLGEEDEGVRTNAHFALKRLSGLELPAQEMPWRAWADAERRWFSLEAPRYMEALDSNNALRASEAIRELAQRRFRRHDLALAIADVLDGPDPGLRALACAGLQQLGSARGVPALRSALEDEDPRVARAAAEALAAITGVAPEPDAGADESAP